MYHIYKYKMDTILWRWNNASETEREYVKQVLMPEDDPDDITMYVTAHPTLDGDDNIVMDWCEIEVYDNKTLHLICSINVSVDVGDLTAPIVSYDWHVHE